MSVANSHLVVEGRVAAISQRTITPDGSTACVIEIRVSKPLKGKVGPSLRVKVDKLEVLGPLADPAGKPTPGVWFLGDPLPGNDSPDNDIYPVVRLDNFANAPTRPSYDMSFHPVKTEREEVDSIQKFVKENPNFTSNGDGGAYWEIARKWRENPDPNKLPKAVGFEAIPSLPAALVVPLVPSVEKTAKEMIIHPETLLPSNLTADAKDKQIARIRAEGLLQLVYFKSPSNVDLVKRYVDESADARSPADPVTYTAKLVLKVWKAS